MILLRLIPWAPLEAFRDNAKTRRWLTLVRLSSLEAFRRGMRSPKSGRIYRRRGRLHRASAPGEYPAVDTGNLIASMKSHQRKNEVGIGTNMFYARFLRTGTSKMARRKMSDNALREGIDASKGKHKGFVRWRKMSQIRRLS